MLNYTNPIFPSHGFPASPPRCCKLISSDGAFHRVARPSSCAGAPFTGLRGFTADFTPVVCHQITKLSADLVGSPSWAANTSEHHASKTSQPRDSERLIYDTHTTTCLVNMWLYSTAVSRACVQINTRSEAKSRCLRCRWTKQLVWARDHRFLHGRGKNEKKHGIPIVLWEKQQHQ